MGCFEYHDQITKWLEESYLTSFIANNKFCPFLNFSKTENTNECTFMRNLRGLHDNHSNQKGKVVDGFKKSTMSHFSPFRCDLHLYVQVNQASFFVVEHHFILSVIVYIFLLAGWEQILWLHWKYDFT